MVTITVALLMSPMAEAAEPTVVLPTGQFPQDVTNVQAAIDGLASPRRGTVVLAARNADGAPTPFNFGTSTDPSQRGQVLAGAPGTGPIAIIGVNDEGAQTTIRGGFSAIVMDRDNAIEVRGIRFEGPQECAICIYRSTRVVIRQNVIVGTIGVRTFANAIRLAPLVSSVASPPTFTGSIDIINNVIDDMDVDYGNGILVFNTDARTRILDNSVFNVATGVRVGPVERPTRIEGNDIVTIETPNLANFFHFGIITFGEPVGSAGRYFIRDNFVESKLPQLISGILLSPQNFDPGDSRTYELKDAVVADNFIILSGGEVAPDAIFRYGIDMYAYAASSSDNLISDNHIRGQALRAFSLQGDPDPVFGAPEYVGNRIVRNDVFPFVATEATIVLEANSRRNRYVGQAGDTVIDQGTDNRIILRH